MKVFKISGTFEQYGRWNPMEEGFEGYFIYDEVSSSFMGYMNELYDCMGYDPMRYIQGVWLPEEKTLHFIKLSSEPVLSPLRYSFKNINSEGLWYAYSLFMGDFNENEEGGAKVLIEEIMEDAKSLEEKIRNKCEVLLACIERVPLNVSLLREPPVF